MACLCSTVTMSVYSIMSYYMYVTVYMYSKCKCHKKLLSVYTLYSIERDFPSYGG